MNDTITIGLKKLENKKRIAILDEARAMDKPHALRLAEWLEESPNSMDKLSAAELRRLHSQNQEMVEALTSIAEYWNQDANHDAIVDACHYMTDTAQAALEKNQRG